VSVTFNEQHLARVPAPWRAVYQNIIRHAIDVSRPADEHWAVTTYEPVESTVVRFDFARDTEAPHSFAFSPEGDDENQTQLFRTACEFLQTNWPSGRQAR